jgi:DNA-binding transcriptional ArsR family regulator
MAPRQVESVSHIDEWRVIPSNSAENKGNPGPMAVTHDEMSETAEKASELLRVLANQKRLLILCKLTGKELSVQELQDETGLGQSTVSQQLAKLRGEKLVSARRQAQSVYYSLSSREVEAVIETLYGLYCSPACDPC